MKMYPNPKRLALLTALCLIPVAGMWLAGLLKRSQAVLSIPALVLPALDQKHTAAVAALVLIAVVGIVKLLTRR